MRFVKRSEDDFVRIMSNIMFIICMIGLVAGIIVTFFRFEPGIALIIVSTTFLVGGAILLKLVSRCEES